MVRRPEYPPTLFVCPPDMWTPTCKHACASTGAAHRLVRLDLRVAGMGCTFLGVEVRKGASSPHPGLVLTTQHHLGGGGRDTTHPATLDPPPHPPALKRLSQISSGLPEDRRRAGALRRASQNIWIVEDACAGGGGGQGSFYGGAMGGVGGSPQWRSVFCGAEKKIKSKLSSAKGARENF